MPTGENCPDQNCRHFDVAIMGGGLAGLCLAAQLRKAAPHLSVGVFERAVHPVPEAAHKVGESTVEISAHYFTKVLGLGDHIKESQLPKYGLRFFFEGEEYGDLIGRPELGVTRFMPRRTYQLDRGRFENHLADLIRELGAELTGDAYVRDLTIASGDEPHSFTYGSGNKVTCRWLVDASGRAALLKRKLDLKAECAHKVNAVWFRLPGKIDMDEWSSDPVWQAAHNGESTRWFSTNHLMGEGYWVWVIPLPEATSVGIVADPRFHPLEEMNSFEGALEWLREHEPACFAEVDKRKDGLMDFLALKHFSRRSKQVFSGDRWASVGDAGIFLDPFYSPGSDYISFANTLIADLIVSETGGRKVNDLARIYNDMMIGFSDSSFQLYTDQYEIFGDPTVMPLKIVWDFALYWSCFAFYFIHGDVTDLSLIARIRDDLDYAARMNVEMQAFFREWRRHGPARPPQYFVNLSKIPYLYGLNEALTKPLDKPFNLQLSQNLNRLRYFAKEIVDRARKSYPAVNAPEFVSELEPSPEAGVLEDTFSKLGL